ncbi:unnamed protein product [Closterium sp. Naga37s-1]|nr:unnamed protein product [Closterium sp. Naga37s-1]
MQLQHHLRACGDQIASSPCAQGPAQSTDGRTKLSYTRNSSPRGHSQHGRQDLRELIGDFKALVKRAATAGESKVAIHLDQVPTAAGSGPVARQLEPPEREEEVQLPTGHPQAEQTEGELQGRVRPVMSCSGSPAQLSPRALQPTQPIARPQASTAAHTHRHLHAHDPPSNHHDRHGGNSSAQGDAGAEESHGDDTPTHALSAETGRGDGNGGVQATADGEQAGTQMLSETAPLPPPPPAPAGVKSAVVADAGGNANPLAGGGTEGTPTAERAGHTAAGESVAGAEEVGAAGTDGFPTTPAGGGGITTAGAAGAAASAGAVATAGTGGDSTARADFTSVGARVGGPAGRGAGAAAGAGAGASPGARGGATAGAGGDATGAGPCAPAGAVCSDAADAGADTSTDGGVAANFGGGTGPAGGAEGGFSTGVDIGDETTSGALTADATTKGLGEYEKSAPSDTSISTRTRRRTADYGRTWRRAGERVPTSCAEGFNKD